MREKKIKTRIETLGYKQRKPPSTRAALVMLKLRYEDLPRILEAEGADASSRLFNGKYDVDGWHYYFRLHFKRVTPQTPKSQPQLRHIITSRTKPLILSRNEEVYTVSQLADLLQISRVSVLDLITSGELEAFVIGSSWRITGTALNTYINKNLERLKEAASVRRKDKGAD